MKAHESPAVPLLDLSRISTTIREQFPFTADLEACVPLAGDASNRRYYRLHLSKASAKAVILMQLAHPEDFKVSEEAVGGMESGDTELPFINILKHLQHISLHVPTLYHYDKVGGFLYLEDFGDVTLAEACRTCPSGTIERLYRQAIDQLIQLHLKGSHPSGACLAFSRSFTAPLFIWEFDHFLEFGIVARHGKPMCFEDYIPVREEFSKIAEWLSAQPQVLSHRDYHSRNLMVDGERLGIIDFQDALMGPATYDLASLLRDSYMVLDEAIVDHLLAQYMEGMCRKLPSSQRAAMLLNDAHAFRRLFDITSIQRNLKAAGRFVYIDQVKGNPTYLASIPHTLKNVRANLEKYPELHRLKRHLAPYIPEWQ